MKAPFQELLFPRRFLTEQLPFSYEGRNFSLARTTFLTGAVEQNFSWSGPNPAE